MPLFFYNYIHSLTIRTFKLDSYQYVLENNKSAYDWIAKSPLHFLISQNLVVLNFVGMKTGKNYALPLSYFEDPKGQLSCVTDRRNVWWRNLLHATNTKILYKGRLTDARVTLEHEDNKIISDQLDALCSHSRIDGFFAKVGYKNGKPIQKDIEKAASIMTLIQLSIY
ncbi:MAG: hypothetical protein CM1200mP18_23120 [Gammaproteobacteria bacterium]|nr:MAG: hypothetical protein CM1200mP18_23120 [Gammaproteobacteria bacterium]